LVDTQHLFEAVKRQNMPRVDVGAIVAACRSKSFDGSPLDDGRRLLHQ
jgi:hypothetical protein